MNNPLSKTPFLFLLVPLILGIVLTYYKQTINWSIIISLFGAFIILLSYLLKREYQFRFRWLFGIGAFCLFFSLGGAATVVKQASLDYTLSDSTQTYVAHITDTPQEKPRSVACNLYLEKENIHVLAYLQKDSTRQMPIVGDEIAFQGKLQAFKNAGNPDDFDYKAYMYNQGFVASSYLSSASWISTGKSEHSLRITALKVRQKIMNFYTSLGFKGDEHAILSALTLGYQDTLSDDIKQGFRTTGTVHILSVSGLHVGIIYALISFLLSFITSSSRFHRFRPLLIILLLWVYAFITGLPPSVVRASIMLTIFCLSATFGRKNSSLNTLYIAAFGMLLYNPFWLFDIGFQLSFVSVLSILVLHRRMVKVIKIENKYMRYIWQMFALSVVAQLATFPLCLYYFGTFPTYFFLANLIIVPLVSLIIYGVGIALVAWGVASLLPAYSEAIYYLPTHLVQGLVKLMTNFVHLFQELPFALVEDVDLSFLSLLILIAIIISLLIAGIGNNSKVLITSLSLFIIFLSIQLADSFTSRIDQLIVYNRFGTSEIVMHKGGESQPLGMILNEDNPVLELGNRKILFLNKVLAGNIYTDRLFDVDCIIIIISDLNVSLSYIEQFYKTSTLVVDSSLKSHVRKRLTKECENKGISLHDVSEKGAFSIIF